MNCALCGCTLEDEELEAWEMEKEDDPEAVPVCFECDDGEA